MSEFEYLVLDFSDPAACEAQLTGGKGSSLARNMTLGFPVPDGFVVTSQAYDLFVGEDCVQGGENASEIKSKLENRMIPEEIVAVVKSALRRFDTGVTFAVRSSGTMEDLEGAAFAGQHDTFLGVKGLDEVIQKIKACFLSLWSEHAYSYRQARNFDHGQAKMAVVIQVLVPAEIAGVAFTIDPVGGRVDRVFIDAAWGLGETVVSGESETDQFLLERANLSVISHKIGNKEHAILQDGQKTVRVSNGDKASQRCLTDEQCRAIAALALQVEQAAGFPQDIEWAIAGKKPYLLQARPVTVLPERWTRDESAERFPNPVTPLTWDFVESGFHDALAHSLALMGMPPLTGRWFDRFDQYIYGNQNAVDVYMGRPPAMPRSLDELRLAIPVLRKKFTWAIELPNKWIIDLDNYLIALGKVNSAPLKEMSLSELWQHVAKINTIGGNYFRSNIAISLTQNMLHKGLAYALHLVLEPEKAARMHDALTSSVETKTAQVNEEIRLLAEMISAEPELQQLLNSVDAKSVVAENRLAGFPAFKEGFEIFLKNHGHRELDFDPYCSNWLDSPWTALNTILLASRATQQSGEEKALQLRMNAVKAEHELLSILPEDLRFFFSELIRLTRSYTSLDDIEHYQTSRLTVPIRHALGEIGTRLMAQNGCEEPMDVYFAQASTLAEYCTNPGPVQLEQLAKEIRINKADYLAACEQEPPHVLGESNCGLENGQAEGSDADLTGVPGSPGVAEGKVCIVRGTDDFMKFEEGDILVTRTTNPAWTPLFHIAKGVVVESGGPLSHGAVTAREMGIPAVMAIKGVMNQLSDGEKIRIDGAAGRVTRLSAE